MKNLIRLALAFSCLLCEAQTQAQTAYTIQDIGTFRGYYPTVTGLNNNGEIVVNFFDNKSSYLTGLYSGGKLQDITAQAGIYAAQINDAGQIAIAVGAQNQDRAALYNIHTGQTQIIGPPLPAANEANAINQQGDAAGFVRLGGAALFKNGQTTLLGSDAAQTIYPLLAKGINSSDQVVGFGTDNNSNFRPFLYSNGVTYNLGTLPNGRSANAYAINDSGIVVGYSEYDSAGGNYHPFVYQNGKMQDLGTFGGPSGAAKGINNAGVIVGSAEYLGFGDPFAPFIYSNGVMRNLFDLIPDGSAWSDGFGDAVNDNGQIAGSAYHNGRLTLFLATPVAVPEPGALTYCAFGVLAAAGLLRRRLRAA